MRSPPHRFPDLGAAAYLLLAAILGPATAEERKNHFDDPFLQATSSIADCPAPEGPLVTEAEVRERAHVRAQHGGSCYLSGRCRLPNSYLYDKEIAPRVVQYIRRDGRFDDSSLWVLSQRRVVTLLGCVASREQADVLERSVMLVDDVMNVVLELRIGGQGTPPYRLAAEAAKR